jgi:hypothetical protein
MQIKPGDFGGEKRNRDVSAQGSGIRDSVFYDRRLILTYAYIIKMILMGCQRRQCMG